MGQRYLNLDKLVGDEYKIEVKGRVFDVSEVPARKMVAMMKFNQDVHASGDSDDPAKTYEVFEAENELIVDALGKDEDGEPADYDWLVENLTTAQLLALLQFVSEAMTGNANFTKPGTEDTPEK